MKRRLLIGLAPVLLALALAAPVVHADEKPLHPPFPLKDAFGRNVLEFGDPVSPARTCTECHDAQYIATHSYHADAGLAAWGKPGGAPWADGAGPFGGWDPLRYRRYSSKDGARFDLGRAAWILALGRRHVGGGPSVFTNDDGLLERLMAGGEPDVDTHVWDAIGNGPTPWDWQASGALELDCFLCHIRRPAGEARAAEIALGRFRDAPTATLSNTGLVVREGDRWTWNRAAFDADGNVDLSALAATGHRLGPPESGNCGLCHGPVGAGPAPITGREVLGRTNAETRGQVFAAQRLRDSALNLAGKEHLHRPFDVHAERLLECSSCHFSPNNPAHASQATASRPRHLTFDARRPAIGEFLRRPNHNLARGRDGSMRGCADCHTTAGTHDWLPYPGRHMAALRCETCHIPHVYGAARRVTDWTVLRSNGEPRIEYRGVKGRVDAASSLVTGFEPVLLSRRELDGSRKLTPYNVIGFWYWVEETPHRPVRKVDLERALWVEGDYHPELKALLDEDADGRVDDSEVALDTDAKVAAVRERLLAVGVTNPSIAAELRPYGLHHTIATGTYATRDCRVCHDRQSRVAAPLEIASFAPGGVLPRWAGDDRVRPAGTVTQSPDARVLYRPDPTAAGVYVLGHDRVPWIDTLGLAAVLAVLLGAGLHGVLRFVAARRRRPA